MPGAVRVVGFAGSPRRGGNTDMLLDAVLAGADEAGAAVERYVLRDLDIHPCRHCGGCTRTGGKCVVQDDMQTLYQPLRAADRIVIASPMFFMSLTATAKTMIDRCQPFWVLKYLVHQPVASSTYQRAGLFLGVGGTKYKTLFDSSRLILRSWFTIIEVPTWHELTYREVDDKGAIARHPTALAEARQAGQELAAQQVRWEEP